MRGRGGAGNIVRQVISAQRGSGALPLGRAKIEGGLDFAFGCHNQLKLRGHEWVSK